MLHAFILVLVDLWNFLLGFEAVPPVSSPVNNLPKELPPKISTETISAAPKPLTLPATSVEAKVLLGPTTAPLPLVSDTTNPTALNKPGMLYVVERREGANLFKDPLMQFDMVLRHIPFGQIVALRQFVGAYAEVLANGQIGFMHKEALTPNLETVWPSLAVGTTYLAESKETQIFRHHINDAFLGGALHMPLTAEEYISVRLLRDRLAIPWPPDRPRLAGTWHTMLRGVTGVRSQITPQPDTIIEWFLEDEVGRLGYVEAVLPDETLKISAVGVMVAGEYTESIVPAAVWREWRPVFINVR